MNKIVLIISCILGISTQAFSQDKSKGALNFSFSSATTAIMRTRLEGAGGYSGDGFYGFGLSYVKPLKKGFDLELGVGYSKYAVSNASNFYPGQATISQKGNLELLSIPLTVRANFLKYLFVNAGIVTDFETKSTFLDNQSGIGAIAGVGFKYNVRSNLSVFVNPYLQQHAVIAFHPEKYQQRVLDAGARLGVGLRL